MQKVKEKLDKFNCPYSLETVCIWAKELDVKTFKATMTNGDIFIFSKELSTFSDNLLKTDDVFCFSEHHMDFSEKVILNKDYLISAVRL